MAGKVTFSTQTIGMCLCPKCPVQAKSQCVAKLKGDLASAIKRSPLSKAEIPAVYCSTGKATCTDLDTKQNCLCFGCPVFAKYNLDKGRPVGYYCRDGAAQ
jgi:hypothetical protein